MNPLFRNILLAFGVVALGVMCWLVDIPDDINWELAAVYLPAVIGIWGVVYCLNAYAAKVIIDTVGNGSRIPFWQSFKLTLSAFAYTFLTPFGFGGGPFRVLELSRFIGMPRAISSVTLYSLMHILGHFMQWATCVVIFIVVYTDKMTPFLWTLFGVYMVVFLTVVVVFNWFYTNGLLERLFKIFFYVPGLKGWSRRLYARNTEAFRLADENVMYLKQNPRAFWSSLVCEYAGRLLNAWEFWFILTAFGLEHVTYADALLVIGFSSLVGNVLYVLPLQLGAREGGLAIILHVLYGTTAGVGIFASFYTRIRELFWVTIGVSLVKVANKSLMKAPAAEAVAFVTQPDAPVSPAEIPTE